MVFHPAFLRLVSLVINLVVLFTLKAEAAEAKLRVESVKLSSGYLTCNLVGENLFSDKALNFMNKGFTSVVEYTVELWEERGLWFDELVVSRKLIYSVDHPDVLSSEYKVIRWLSGVTTESVVNSIDDAVAVTQYNPKFRLTTAGKLDRNGLYYIVVWAQMRSLTAQNLEDVRRWLKDLKPGEEEIKAGSITSKLSSMVFGLASDFLISQNTLRVQGQSRTFSPKNLK